MPGTRIPIDGLWRCLCPSFDSNTLARVIRTPLKPTSQTRHTSRPTSCKGTDGGRRSFHDTKKLRDFDTAGSPLVIKKHVVGPPPVPIRRTRPISRIRDQPSPEATLERLLQAIPPYERELEGASNKTIYYALRKLLDENGKLEKIQDFVNFLLKARRERPTPFMFDCVVQSEAHRDGSANELWLLFEWMEACGIRETLSIYDGVLRALAVHPDYMLRNKIFRDMKTKWIDVSAHGRTYEAIGLLRDGQYELALDALENMVKSEAPVPDFLFDIFTLAYCKLGFLDEALKITSFRAIKDDGRIAISTWHFLLDWCSRQLHHQGTRYIWNHTVRTRLLNPSDAICANVLDTAARAHDIELATEATQYMAARGGKLNTSHFEALIECYAGAADVTNAIQTLCLMRDAGIAISAGSTRSLFAALKDDTNLFEPAIAALFSLRAKFDIPLPAFNVVLEAMLAVGDSDAGFDLYRHVRALCPDPPDASTFRMLFRSARNHQDFVFLDREMRSFGVVAGKAVGASPTSYKPDARVRRVLLDAHALHGDLDVAVNYLSTLTASGFFAREGQWLAKETAVTLLRRCFAEWPDPVPWLVKQAERHGMSLQAELDELVRGAEKQEASRADIARDVATGSG